MLCHHHAATNPNCAIFQFEYPRCTGGASKNPSSVCLRTCLDNWNHSFPMYQRTKKEPFTCELEVPLTGEDVEYKFILNEGLDNEEWVLAPKQRDNGNNNVFCACECECPEKEVEAEECSDDPLWQVQDLFVTEPNYRRKVPFSFHVTHHHQKVELWGSWDDWSNPIPMTKRSAHEAFAQMYLPPGIHVFKFRYPDTEEWALSDELAVHTGLDGVQNHCVSVSAFRGAYLPKKHEVPSLRHPTYSETPSADAALLFEEDAEDLRQPCEFTWPFSDAKDVYIVTSADGFRERYKMNRSEDGHFSRVLDLLPGEHFFKFIIDGEWNIDPTAPTAYDGPHENNVLRVRSPEVLAAAGIGF